MLGVDRATVSSLLAEGKLGWRKIGDFKRIFLSDLEDYLGEARARSLVCDINSGAEDAGSGTFRSGTSEGSASDHDDSTDIESDAGMYTSGDDSRKDRMFQYEPVLETWSEIDKNDEAIVLADLSENDVENIRTLLYRRIGKENVIVRSAEQADGMFKAVVRARKKAVVRARKDDKYLKE